ncbi:hypothetical protein GSI_05505 [Ganoderma sinense ZZ0214-1]|uniref:DUF6534 domain-containing protein n=1 Tax=Ganoderma sinense ZZ0214-1 TaxID=1077348 RepID=A0A2G8SES5_9APHY|nr:hypothetical protein GSI_05505 [Ganoderma sinense ZZ0214-1]
MNQTAAAAETAFLLAHLNRGGTIGVSLIGVAVSAMIYGVTCIQTFQYYRSENYKEDQWIVKTLVPVLLVLDSTHEIFIIHIAYHYLITNYGNPQSLELVIWTIPAEIIVNAVIAFLVDGFFCVRVWKLSQNRFATGICAFATVTHLATNLLYPIRIFAFPSLLEAETKLKATGTSGLGVGVVADVSISTAMVWSLTKEKIRSLRTASMVDRLVMLTITSGLLTTVFEIVDLIAYVVAPSLLYNLFFNFLLGKLYVNAYLTSLNSRDYVRGSNANVVSLNSIVLSSIQMQGMETAAGQTMDSAPGRTMVGTVEDNCGSRTDMNKTGWAV